MADALTVQSLKDSRNVPLVPTMESASANGNKFKNTGDEILFIDSARDSVAGDVTLTLPQRDEIDGVPLNKTVTVPYGAEILAGPFLTDIYSDDNENVQLTWSSPTNVTLAAIRVEDTV